MWSMGHLGNPNVVSRYSTDRTLVPQPREGSAVASIPGGRPTAVPDGGWRHDAFAAHIEPHLGVLVGVARTLAPNAEDADDLVQDTVLRAYRALHRFDGRHARAWLLTIMRNQAANRGRRGHWRRPRPTDDPMARAGTARSAEDEAMAAVIDGRIGQALARLPLHAREVVALVDVAGLSYQQAADVLDVPIGTVMSRLHRARSRLRRRLERHAAVTALALPRS